MFGRMAEFENKAIRMLLNFRDLLAKAYLDLPEEVDLSSLVQRSGNRYSVKGLYDLSDDAASQYIGTPEEVILRNLHDAIYAVLHDAAAYITRVRISELRPEAIRLRFERHLHNGIKIPELNYRPEDIELVKKYFHVNETTQPR